MGVAWKEDVLVLLAEFLEGVEELEDFIAQGEDLVLEEELHVYKHLVVA